MPVFKVPCRLVLLSMVLVYFNQRKISWGEGTFEDFQTPLVDSGNEKTELSSGKNEGFSLKDKENRCKSHPRYIYFF